MSREDEAKQKKNKKDRQTDRQESPASARSRNMPADIQGSYPDRGEGGWRATDNGRRIAALGRNVEEYLKVRERRKFCSRRI